jgi:hypothetical protein
MGPIKKRYNLRYREWVIIIYYRWGWQPGFSMPKNE